MTNAPMSNPTPIDSAQPAPNEATDLNTVLTRAWETLSKEGQQEVIDRAAEAYRTPPRAPVITVIGEVKRGKSSLVNCLLGGRDLSPVDVDIATSAFLRFVPADGERQDGAASLVFAGSRRRDVQLSELGDWVTENGSRVTDPEVDALPVGAEIAVAGEFLPGTVLVDTPGVGGLNPSHLRLATERRGHFSAAELTEILWTTAVTRSMSRVAGVLGLEFATSG